VRKRGFEHGVVYNGDCLEVMPEVIEDHSIDMILADLPYKVTACHWDSLIPFDELWHEYNRIRDVKTAIILTGVQPFSSFLVTSNPELFKYEWIWEKSLPTGFLHVNKRPLQYHEHIIVFYERQPVYHPQMRKGAKNHTSKSNIGAKRRILSHVQGASFIAKPQRIDGVKSPGSVQRFKVQDKLKVSHPSQKPVELFQYLIMTYTNKGDVVLDNVIGSGTTAIAAYNTGRRWIGIEKDPEIFDMACERIEKETRQQNLFN